MRLDASKLKKGRGGRDPGLSDTSSSHADWKVIQDDSLEDLRSYIPNIHPTEDLASISNYVVKAAIEELHRIWCDCNKIDKT